MSNVSILAVKIDAVSQHPHADRLDLVTIAGYTTVVARDDFKVGDIVVHFPPDILIPEGIATQLGVIKYLKSAIYPGDSKKTNCRVGAVRLRGAPSFGFVMRLKGITLGEDLTHRFNGVKYEPVEPKWWNQTGDASPDNPIFHLYTDIENYRNPRFRGAFKTGLPVRITEKIHGTNSRVALISGNYYAGSHKVNKKEFDTKSNRTLYWTPMTNDMQALLWYFAEHYGQNVIVFGEIYGSKIQFMSYGVTGQGGYRVFDISVNGQYINWGEVKAACDRFCIPTVPLLYTGPFYEGLVDRLVDGPTTVLDTRLLKEKFTGREGIVITPLHEDFSDILGGRLIMKAVSCDYLESRKSDSH